MKQLSKYFSTLHTLDERSKTVYRQPTGHLGWKFSRAKEIRNVGMGHLASKRDCKN